MAKHLPLIFIVLLTALIESMVGDTNATAPPPSPLTESKAKTETEVEAIAVAGILNFTMEFQKILGHLSSSDGNVLFAPVNLIGTLATLLLGADGESKNEILHVLGLISGRSLLNKEEKIHNTLGKLLHKFVAEHENNTAIKVLLANSLFIEKNATVGKKFIKSAQEYYDNEVTAVDFGAGGNAAVNLINQWAANHTNGIINQIIEPPLMPNTLMIIASTLFFNGEWDQPFYENSTWQHFYTDDGIIQVKMMVNKGPALIYDDPVKKFSVLGIPYKGKDVYMYLILPYKDVPIHSLINILTPKDITDIAAKATLEQEVTYLVPYLELSESINVETALKHAGVQTLFDADKANLNNIAKGIHVSDAIHKVNLHVTEAGSTGAAATTISIETRFPDRNVFNFNRPYAFYVYHKSTTLISFWGTVAIPTPHKKL
ncbi:serpin B13-like isoform X3 [Planococcus citri]|uniref:serpin B13-like isoform X2 n=1 Tax=Planococcus citri TaxID=170843 RepID=UPI0031F9C900